MCQVRFKKISKKSFKGVSRMSQLGFVLQFCCCTDLIAATRAEGGLVFFFSWGKRSFGGSRKVIGSTKNQIEQSVRFYICLLVCLFVFDQVGFTLCVHVIVTSIQQITLLTMKFFKNFFHIVKVWYILQEYNKLTCYKVIVISVSNWKSIQKQ